MCRELVKKNTKHLRDDDTMIDTKQIAIDDMKATLEKLESTLRAGGSVEFKCYHNTRGKQLAEEFLKMADDAKRSIDFAEEMV